MINQIGNFRDVLKLGHTSSGDSNRVACTLDPPEGYAVEIRALNAFYGEFLAVRDISLPVSRKGVTAVIGPSGCGKSTLVRCLNRMHELVGGRVEGQVLFEGQDIYARGVDAVDLRSRIGMVFQKPNPFPKSIFENVAFGLRINGYPRGEMAEIVEASLHRAALWDEVKDRLNKNALALSGGQQQRLCIARALAVEPELILMDEPCSALDPMATLAIEDLIRSLAEEYTIVIVTHNMQQAARVSDETAFLTMGEDRAGFMVEHGATQQIFTNPADKRTEDYITGRFG